MPTPIACDLTRLPMALPGVHANHLHFEAPPPGASSFKSLKAKAVREVMAAANCEGDSHNSPRQSAAKMLAFAVANAFFAILMIG